MPVVAPPPALPPAPAPAPVAPDVPARVNQLEAFLAELVAALTPARGRGRGRPPILPALLLWAGLAVCVLRGWSSQRALWRLVSAAGLWHFPRAAVGDEAVYRRLERAQGAPPATFFAQLTPLLAARLAPCAAAEPAPFAAEVVALDETPLDPVARTLPTLREVPAGDDRLLPGTLAGVFDLRRQLFRHVAHLPAPRQNEQVAARDLVADLPRGSLILADLGSFGFAWFDDVADAGHQWVSRRRGTTSDRVIHPRSQHGEPRDALVWLGAHHADQAKHAVRLVQVRLGPTRCRSVTTGRDPPRLPSAEVARRSARRWGIELAGNLAKRDLGLHLLRSAKEAVLLHQVWAVLILAQVLQALRLEVAGRAGVDPFEVSLPLLIQYLPPYAARGHDPIAAFVADGRHLGFIRPSRRTHVQAPEPPLSAFAPPPPDLVRVRTPRYARRKGDRPAANAN